MPPKDAATELQNALARLGATHLAESTDVLPSERLKEVHSVVRETLTNPDSPRQITALAPVLVNHSEGVNFAKLASYLGEIGLSSRLGWVVENTVEALRAEIKEQRLSPRERLRYQRGLVALEYFLSYFSKNKKALALIPAPAEDLFDAGIGSEETLAQVKKQRSAISKDWHIITGIEPEDFRKALEAARGAH